MYFEMTLGRLELMRARELRSYSEGGWSPRLNYCPFNKMTGELLPLVDGY